MTPLNNGENPRVQHVIAPEKPVGASVLGPDKDKDEKKFSLAAKKIIIGATAGVAGVAIAGGVALGLNNNKEEGPINEGQSTSEPVTPTPPKYTFSPSPEETSSPEAPQTIPESLVKYQEMSVEQFEQLPWEEQLNYWGWLSRDIDAFAQEYYKASVKAAGGVGNPNDMLPTNPASPESTAQEAVSYATIAQRLVLTLKGDDAYKALSIVTPNRGINDSDTEAYNIIKGMLDQDLGELPPGAIAVTNVVPVVDVSSEISRYTDQNNRLSIQSEGTVKKETGGAKRIGVVVLGTYLDPFTNETKSGWF